jgi:ABC-type siderophore export system fused ATPase/permease subunit
MNTLAIISGTFHILAVIFILLLMWERNWWRREAEALQRQAWKTANQIREMTWSIEDAREELTLWEMKAAELWQDRGYEWNRQHDAEKS